MDTEAIVYNNITMPYQDAAKDYPKLKTLFSNAVSELETITQLPCFKHTQGVQVTLVFDDDSNGEPVGFAIWFYDPNDKIFFIGLVYVEPTYRRKGYACKLYEVLTSIAKDLYQAKYMSAAVVNNNLASILLHQEMLGDPKGLLYFKRL